MRQSKKILLPKDKANTIDSLENKLNEVKKQIDAIDEKFREAEQITNKLTIEQFKDKPKKEIKVIEVDDAVLN